MPNVDVIYQGLELAKAASLRAEEAGGFLALDSPMPVGTHLELHGEDGVRGALVERVREGAGAGVQIRFVARPETTDGDGEQTARDPNAPVVVDAEKTVLDEESSKSASGKHRRRKTKKTFPGR